MSAVINEKIIYKDVKNFGKFGSVVKKDNAYYIYLDKDYIRANGKSVSDVVEHELWHIVFMQYKTITNQEQIVRIICEYKNWVENAKKTI